VPGALRQNRRKRRGFPIGGVLNSPLAIV